MIDLYLRADTAEALRDACPFLWDGEGEQWVLGTVDFAFDPIGPVVVVPSAYDDEGNQLSPPVIDWRFHANLRCTPDIAALVPGLLLVTPGTPRRVWA